MYNIPMMIMMINRCSRSFDQSIIDRIIQDLKIHFSLIRKWPEDKDRFNILCTDQKQSVNCRYLLTIIFITLFQQFEKI
ncbi:hypothetical protein DERP_000147 [Dermatophagoides pteronyssinus]|uniref:Uncharacterized protein n=1 Tax=Dermatophagoides pteronyssinus TaxID=6956 RepID=A0ABQ8IZA9_DERPT|nr:hypothetical protein DERP_000147 [Dermatophagoides pteronyssinus]